MNVVVLWGWVGDGLFLCWLISRETKRLPWMKSSWTVIDGKWRAGFVFTGLRNVWMWRSGSLNLNVSFFNPTDSSPQMVLLTSGLGESLLAETEMWPLPQTPTLPVHLLSYFFLLVCSECSWFVSLHCTCPGCQITWWLTANHMLCMVWCSTCTEQSDTKP